MSTLLDTDAISTLGCNIATGIILENIADKDIKGKIYYLNIKTLYRNYINCLSGKTDDKVRLLKNKSLLNKVYDGFIEDTKIVVDAIINMGMEPVLYNPDYKEVTKFYNKRYNNFKSYDDFTGVKYFILITEERAIFKVMELFKGVVKKTTHKLPYFKDMFITSHIGLDLLNYVNKRDVILLESHTGVMKKYDMWYTKYHKIGKLPMNVFPFTELLYVILGDDNFIRPLNIKIRKEIHKVAINNGWYTSMDGKNIINLIRKYDITLGNEIKSLFKSFY